MEQSEEPSEDTLEVITVKFTAPILYIPKELLEYPEMMFIPEED